jgi:hypothetical protein
MIPLEFAVSQTSSGVGPGKSLCARLYAYVLARQQRFEEAYQWAYAASSVWPCVGAQHEKTRYACLSGRLDVARQELDTLVRCSPLGIVMAYADPAISVLGQDLLEGSIREQMRLRQVAREEIAGWEAVAKKSADVRRRVPTISIPVDLTDGAIACKAENEDSHFLCAAQHVRRASGAKEDLKCLTAAAVLAEKRKRAEAVNLARQSIEAAMEARENWIRASMAAHEESLKGVRSALSQSNSKGENIQKGCGWGLSTGCAALVGYGILALVLSVRGIMIGPTTHWGIAMLTLASLPVLVALAFHLSYSVRRMMLDSQVNSQIAASNEEYERSREEANEQFRGIIEGSQAQLAEEEKHLLRVEDALRILS